MSTVFKTTLSNTSLSVKTVVRWPWMSTTTTKLMTIKSSWKIMKKIRRRWLWGRQVDTEAAILWLIRTIARSWSSSIWSTTPTITISLSPSFWTVPWLVTFSEDGRSIALALPHDASKVILVVLSTQANTININQFKNHPSLHICLPCSIHKYKNAKINTTIISSILS